MIPRARGYTLRAYALATCALAIVAVNAVQAQARDPLNDIVGLWKAKRRFGPDARGPLLIQRSGTTYTADMMGFTFPVTVNNGELSFELPNRQAGFRGKLVGNTIRAIWFSSPLGELGAATPVILSPNGPNSWLGQVVPLEDTQTFYLLVTRRADGSLAAFLRNIERDYGGLLGVRG